MKTDDQYLEAVIKNYTNRKKRAAFGIIFAISYGIFSYYLFNMTHEQITTIEEMVLMTKPGIPITETEIKLANTSVKLVEILGIKLGSFLGFSAAFITISITQSLVLLFGGRKERLLIKYYKYYEKQS